MGDSDAAAKTSKPRTRQDSNLRYASYLAAFRQSTH